MSRGERPLGDGDDAVLRFARDLRLLREKAGKPTYRELSAQAHYSEAALSQAAAGRKLPSLPVTLAYVRACGGSPQDWAARWRQVVAELAVPDPADTAEAPYVGLAAFQPGDVDLFFGRERLVEQLCSRLAERRVVVVFGASGVGKSSLLRAGLIPRLDGPVLLFTPGAHPLEECAIELARLTGAPVGPLAGHPRALYRAIRQAAPAGGGLVIVVDQFEEVFTLCHDQDERHRFVEALLTAAHAGGGRCRLVLGVRADFYGHCTAVADLLAALPDGTVTVGPMTRDELRAAITRPAVRSGYTVETALVAELVGLAGGQVGVLPLLSHALLETWRRRRGNTLALAGYQAAGGLVGALAQTAESVFAQLSDRQRQVARHLLLRLTALGDGTEDTKRRASRRELDDDPDTRTVLDRLVSARLIAVDRDSVEISHEALIKSWPRLAEWLAEDRDGLLLHRRLGEATDAWEALDRDPGALYRGVRLARTRDWATRDGSALTQRERDYLDASVAAEQADHRLTRRRNRHLRQAVALLSVLLVAAVAATGYAIDEQHTATGQRNIALSQIVAGKAGTLRRTNPSLAAQLSLAAYRLAPTSEARASLIATFPMPYRQRLSGHTANVNTVAFSPDGGTLITASHDRTARVWNVNDPTHPATIATLTHAATVNGASFSPNGQLVATASWDHTAKLWDLTDRHHPVELATLRGHSREVNAVAFSADNRTLATVSTDHTAKVWDISDPHAPHQLVTLTGHTDAVVAAAFRPDRRMLATASFDHTIALWDLTQPGPPTVLPGHTAPVTWVTFNADGTTLASTSQDSTARLWDPTSGRQLGVLTGHDRVVRSATFTPDGRVLATGGEDSTARLWDVSQAGHYHQLTQLQAHTEPVVSVAFGPDGHTLATGSDDDTAALWRVPNQASQLSPIQAAAWICQTVDNPINTSEWSTFFPTVPYQPPCR